MMIIGALIAVFFLVIGFVLGAFVATMAHREIARDEEKENEPLRITLDMTKVKATMDNAFNVEKRVN